MTENWYIVLELEFYPNPVQDEAVIEQKIEEKIKIWVRCASDFRYGTLYRKYCQMIPEIKRDMIGPDNIRDELINDACEKTFKPIDNILKNISNRVLSDEIIDRIARRFEVDVSVVLSRVFSLGVAIDNSSNDRVNEIYNKYYKDKPAEYDKFAAVKKTLRSFGANSIYGFLFEEIQVEKPNKLPSDILLQRVNELKKNRFYKVDANSSMGKQICLMAQEIFSSDEMRTKYDYYLKFTEIKAILDELKLIYEIVGEISLYCFYRYVEILKVHVDSHQLATSIIASFCKVERIPIEHSIANII